MNGGNLKVQYSPSKAHSICCVLNPGASERIPLSLADAKVDAIRTAILSRKADEIRQRFEKHCRGTSSVLEITLKGFQNFIRELCTIKDRQWVSAFFRALNTAGSGARTPLSFFDFRMGIARLLYADLESQLTALMAGAGVTLLTEAELRFFYIAKFPANERNWTVHREAAFAFARTVMRAADPLGRGFASVADVLFAALEAAELVEALQRGLGIHPSAAAAAAAADALRANVVPKEPPRPPPPAAREGLAARFADLRVDPPAPAGPSEEEEEACLKTARRRREVEERLSPAAMASNLRSRRASAPMLAMESMELHGPHAPHAATGAPAVDADESLCGVAHRRSGYDQHGRARSRPHSASPLMAGAGSRAAMGLRSPGGRLPPSVFAVRPDEPPEPHAFLLPPAGSPPRRRNSDSRRHAP